MEYGFTRGGFSRRSNFATEVTRCDCTQVVKGIQGKDN